MAMRARWLGFDPATPPGVRGRVALVLAAAVVGISSSAVIVRGMEGADPLAIAAWRTLATAALLLPWARTAAPALSARDGLAIAVAGAALGLHFWSWFASLSATTVLRSTLLVCTVPAWTALIEWGVLGVRPSPRHWLGLLIALPGLGLLAGSGGEATWTGDGLALVAAVLWAIYFLLSRSVRQRTGAGATMAGLCAVAAAVLFPVALVTGTPLTGFSPATWGLIALAVAGPQLVGHLGFVYAVRWVPASTVSMITLLEPVGAAALAAPVLGEWPGPEAALGSAIVLAGIGVASWQPEPPTDPG
jgi:drug/metabolite transporter (DMT)-like permease